MTDPRTNARNNNLEKTNRKVRSQSRDPSRDRSRSIDSCKHRRRGNDVARNQVQQRDKRARFRSTSARRETHKEKVCVSFLHGRCHLSKNDVRLRTARHVCGSMPRTVVNRATRVSHLAVEKVALGPFESCYNETNTLQNERKSQTLKGQPPSRKLKLT